MVINKTITKQKKLFPSPQSPVPSPYSLLLFLSLLLASCSFDYGNQDGADKSQPDIVMENVEYVRIRSAEPQARLQAERLERFEERRIIELRNLSFEQFGNRGEDVNASGRAGSALMEIDSGDIHMDDGVRIDVDSEDVAIETVWLEWKDKERTLSAREGEEVNIYQENGTTFTGTGFHADAWRRTWEFAGGAGGTYISNDDDDEDDEGDAGEGASKEGASKEATDVDSEEVALNSDDEEAGV